MTLLDQFKKFFTDNAELLLATFFSFISPLIPFMWAVGALIFIDTFTGYWAAGKRGELRTSRALFAGAGRKLTLYPLVILVGALCEFLWPQVPFLRMALAMLAVVEFKSIIFENYTDITGISLKSQLKSFISSTKDDFNVNP